MPAKGGGVQPMARDDAHVADALLAAALDYAARDWPVVPIVPGGKRPLTRHGLKDATTDPDTIAEWWDRWPTANVAIATGAPGPTVIDCDGPIGRYQWSRYVDQIGWQTSPWACTGGGGWHIYYRTDASITNRARALPHVDVRGAGGYVVAPPSRTIGDYWWVATPDERPLPAMPGEVERLCTHRPTVSGSSPPPRPPVHERMPGGDRYGLAALARECDAIRLTRPGARNDRLNRAAWSIGRLVADGRINAEHAAQELIAAAIAAGLNPTEAQRTVMSGLRARTISR